MPTPHLDDPLTIVRDPDRGATPDDAMRGEVMYALADVIDPELGVSIVDLGLVYGIDVVGAEVQVRLTMTTAACPLGEELVAEAEDRVRAIAGVDRVAVELVWDPPWGPERMSEAARWALGWDD